jgi:AAA+ superfamily predicted ATPase
VLDFANQAPFVVLFDEFDSLGRGRDEIAEHGEMKRVVTAFLQMLDQYRGPSVLISATNHPGLLDTALWRRFDEVLTFERPSVHDIRRLLRHRLRSVPHTTVNIDECASRLKGLPHAAVEKAVWDARRNSLLAGREKVSAKDMAEAIAGVRSRPW